MDRRLKLHAILEGIIGEKRAYFQPPVNIELVYPCIVYNLVGALVEHADDLPYKQNRSYQITIIDPDPDTEFYCRVASLPMTNFDRFYAADDLNHFVFSTYI